MSTLGLGTGCLEAKVWRTLNPKTAKVWEQAVFLFRTLEFRASKFWEFRVFCTAQVGECWDSGRQLQLVFKVEGLLL